MAGLQIDPEELRRAAAEMQAAADELDEALGQFVQGLGGDPWGMDMLGTLIGGGYAAVEQLALQTFDSVVTTFDSVSERLEIMADNYATAEDEIGTSFTSIQSRL
jgi:hypothetical protein